MAEFGIGFSAYLVTEIVKSISRTIKRQVLYVFKHKNYVNDLKDQVQQLNLKRERVKVDADYARRQGHKIHKDVGKWLEDVNRFVQQEADPIIENEGQVGTCSLITRYKVGRKAVKAAKAGCSLLGKDFSSVSYRPTLQRTDSMYVDRDYQKFCQKSSRQPSQIMEALKNPHVNRIGLHGMGCVGKTTLAKKVVWQAVVFKLARQPSQSKETTSQQSTSQSKETTSQQSTSQSKETTSQQSTLSNTCFLKSFTPKKTCCSRKCTGRASSTKYKSIDPQGVFAQLLG